MTTDVTRQFAQERRARLAAERQLDLRQRDLKAANERMERRSRVLTEAILEKRAQLDQMQAEIDEARRDSHNKELNLLASLSDQARVESMLWQALESMRDGFAIFDADLRLVCANRAYLSIFDGLDAVKPGIALADLCALMVDEGIVDPQMDGALWARQMCDRYQSLPVPDSRLWLWNGQIVKLTDRPLDDGGFVSLAINQTRDLRIQSAIEAIGDGFAIYDRDDRLVMCNATYRAIHDPDGDAIVPKSRFIDLLRHGLARGLFADAKGREEAWLEDRMRHHQSPAPTPVEHLLGDGRWLRVQEIETPDGGRAELSVDVTGMKRQQAELDAARVAAERASHAKSTFLANMSHELRTPMNGVIGLTDLLIEGDLSDSQRVMVTTIRESSDALLTIINDILDTTAIEQGMVCLRPAPFDIAECANHVGLLLRTRAVQKGLDLQLDLDPDLPAMVVGDAGRVRQIFINLLGNAVKFTDKGHVRFTLGLTSEDADGRCTLTATVEDSGCGIPPDALPHVFKPFAQADESGARPHDGTGLGLSICATLVKLMAGDIRVLRTSSEGSVFQATMVLRHADRDAAGPRSGDDRAQDKTPSTAVTRRLRVLAAEDNRINRMVLEKMLAPMDLDLRFATNGFEAVEAAKSLDPDLILMDVSMPGLDGRDATRRIRAWQTETGRAPAPIVAITAADLEDRRDEILVAGMDDVLAKPIDRAALLAHVDTVQAALRAASSRKNVGISGSDMSSENT